MEDVHLNDREKRVKRFDHRIYKRYLSSNGKSLTALAFKGISVCITGREVQPILSRD